MLSIYAEQVVGANGQVIPVKGMQYRVGTSCGLDGCLSALLLPWVKGGDAILSAGTKFYVQVKNDLLFDPSPGVEEPATDEIPQEAAGRVTIFSCRPRENGGYSWLDSIEVKMNRQKFVSLEPNHFLTLSLPDGQYDFSTGKDIVPAKISFASRLYIRVGNGNKQGAAIATVEDDDCAEVIEPVDPKSVAKAWRSNIQ
jgi:hypothetical protein